MDPRTRDLVRREAREETLRELLRHPRQLRAPAPSLRLVMVIELMRWIYEQFFAG